MRTNPHIIWGISYPLQHIEWNWAVKYLHCKKINVLTYYLLYVTQKVSCSLHIKMCSNILLSSDWHLAMLNWSNRIPFRLNTGTGIIFSYYVGWIKCTSCLTSFKLLFSLKKNSVFIPKSFYVLSETGLGIFSKIMWTDNYHRQKCTKCSGG